MAGDIGARCPQLCLSTPGVPVKPGGCSHAEWGKALTQWAQGASPSLTSAGVARSPLWLAGGWRQG